MKIEELVKTDPTGLIARAYQVAQHAHKGQKRKTGEAYFTHPMAVANTLAVWQLDEPTIAAGLLHDTVEDTSVTLEDIKKNFGAEVAFLVNGVTKLDKLPDRTDAPDKPSKFILSKHGPQMQLENFRKLVLALSEDLRVIFIKLADRLDNMKTLSVFSPVKQKRIARETEEIYAPLAYRLGMQNVSSELQDLAFPILHPQESRWVQSIVKEKYEERLEYLQSVKPEVEKALHEHGITPRAIDFRAKRHSSLYFKLLRHGVDINQIYDLVAMRVIVNTVEECYATLGIIHQYWPPLPGRIKDYIAMPKPNGYRSLHTTVIGPERRTIELQIRTLEMHQENEHGIAAHWLYKQSGRMPTGKTGMRLNDEMKWIQQLRNWHEHTASAENSEQLLQAMKAEFFKDRIFVFTPKGEVIDLPAGSTPIDFAYAIHTDVGNMCVGAKVNDQFVSLDHVLYSGDLIEILMQKNKKPSPDWLAFVKTTNARDHIRLALKHKRNALGGRSTLTKAELKIVVHDRVGIIKDVSTIISRSHLNILNFQADASQGGKYPIVKIEINTTEKDKIEKLILKLKKIKAIKEIGYKLIP